MIKLLLSLLSKIPGVSGLNTTLVLVSLAVVVVGGLGWCGVSSIKAHMHKERLREGVKKERDKAFKENKKETTDFIEYQKELREKNKEIQKENPDMDAFKKKIQKKVNENIKETLDKGFRKVDDILK